jgi:hypothetical protein
VLRLVNPVVEVTPLDNVIATRTYHDDAGQSVEVRLFQPEPYEDSGGYSCRIDVGGELFTGFGGDSMMALMTALSVAPELLRRRGVSRWLDGWEGLGLPEDIGAKEAHHAGEPMGSSVVKR